MTNISVPEQEPLPEDVNKNFNNDISSRQSDFPSRYWTFLFDNLKRSIEQIYQTCESDQNPLQCQVKKKFHLFSYRLYEFLFSKLYNFFINVVKILKFL